MPKISDRVVCRKLVMGRKQCSCGTKWTICWRLEVAWIVIGHNFNRQDLNARIGVAPKQPCESDYVSGN